MTVLIPRHPGAAADLAVFATRVARFEAEAAIRIVAGGPVAGCFAETPFDVLALRAVELAEPLSLDVVVEAGTLAARAVGDHGELELPPTLPALRWTASLPPRTGWEELARIPVGDVASRVRAGVAEFRSRAPDLTSDMDRRAARTELDRLAAEVWDGELAAGVPLRLAHAADSYGFLAAESGDVTLRSSGSWWRLDAPHGSIVARSGLALFAL
ncbi:MAG TPA: hypothetical protein VFZ37_18860 [Jiangellaceae bacterium]